MSHPEISFLLVLFATMALAVLCSHIGKGALFALLYAVLVGVNIASTKTSHVLGFEITVGTPLYAVTFLISNMVSELYGKEEAQRAIKMGFVVLGGFVIIGMLSKFVPSNRDSDSIAVDTVFSRSTRILTASFLTYLVAQLTNVWLFWLVRKVTAEKYLWLRNGVSTVAAEFVDSIIFFFLAFSFTEKHWVTLAITGFLTKSIIALLDTPFIYICKRIGSRNLL
jgi:uncharacterized integral membrane protein (TIGR00697 family)